MFRRSSSPKSSGASQRGRSPSVISADMNVLGNIVSEGILDIDGRIEGNVRCHTVSVRPNGRVRGDVTADVVMIHGEVQGLVKARSVMLYATARVTGTIMHESLTIEDGAFVDGKFKRTDKVFLDETMPAAISYVPTLDNSFMNDNHSDEPPSEDEIRVLENLRLIS